MGDWNQVTHGRPENELLLCCARFGVGTGEGARIGALLQQELDWDYLLSASTRHAMKPLLCWSLDKTCPEAVPAPFLERLRAYFYDNSRKNLLLTRELLSLLDAFEAEDIPAIPFKGPVLAQSVYGNLALRHFLDVDILVHEQDVPQAAELLVSEGYKPGMPLALARRSQFRQKGHYLFIGKGLVELHWQLTPAYLAGPAGSMWERLEPVNIGGREVPTLATEDLALHLCLHGTKHLWARLAWICDVAKLVEVHQQIDWEWVMEEAGRQGNRRMLFLGLIVAHDLLGTALPQAMEHKIEAEPGVQALARQIKDWLFLETRPGIGPGLVFHSKATEGLGNKIKRGLHQLHLLVSPCADDYAFVSLPESLLFLYYFVRPLRLMGKHSPAALRAGSDEQREPHL